MLLQGKGGIGKTFIASLIAQYLLEHGQPVVCLDTDVVNASLIDITALRATQVMLFKANSDDEVDTDALDGMTERFIKESANFVVDNGATSFKPVSRYILQDGIGEAVSDAGKQLVVHTVIAGGQEMIQTGHGFDSIASQFPPSIKLVVWLNEHHGKVSGGDGSPFEDTPVYRKHASRITALVRLPQLHKAFADNLRDMLTTNMTFAEALSSDNIFTMAKQRLVQIRRPIWDQLAPVM